MVTATLVICALVVTGLMVRRELFTPTPTSVRQSDQKTVLLKDWHTDADKGQHIGAAKSPVQIAEFGDFECPFCGEFRKALLAVDQRHPRAIGLTFLYFPLQGHRFALPAARVAECAAEQGRFEAMYDQLFEGQDQFGLKPWDDYATAAGVPDLVTFDACVTKTDPIPRVEEGKALGRKLNIQGTPTLIINGWKLGRPPSEEELDGMVKKILAGKSPVS